MKCDNLGRYIRVNTPGLIKQVFDNPHTEMLRIPFNTVLRFLGEVAERASELNDPKLNLLMIKLNLYEVSNEDAAKLIDRCYEDIKEIKNE